jgi:hypothetical protein
MNEVSGFVFCSITYIQRAGSAVFPKECPSIGNILRRGWAVLGTRSVGPSGGDTHNRLNFLTI